MGKKSQIIQEMLIMQPDIDFSDTTWGIYADDAASIEINIEGKKIFNVSCCTSVVAAIHMDLSQGYAIISAGTRWIVRQENTRTLRIYPRNLGNGG